MFLGRKPRTTLDLLRSPPAQPIERDVEMARRFNKRFGTKLREFSIEDKVFARHRISQNWQQGKVSKRTGVIYDVAFADGKSGRYHANQLRPRNTSDSDEQLSVMLEAFDIPRPISVEEQRAIPVEMPLEDQHDEQENLGGQIDHGQQRRYPQRNRRPPQRRIS
ncbi:hypothetical protein niasHS_012346 [Heterodera schachtii]|uniref:Uncharacterized protein n=1 Tax=Heterodera schachtii TaxID=97005 RepID=A0ABD2IR56_HETSC